MLLVVGGVLLAAAGAIWGAPPINGATVVGLVLLVSGIVWVTKED